MLKEITEGKTKLFIDSADIVSKELEVFYNPKMKLNRDASLVLLKALQKENIQIGLPLAGTGVRAVRMLNELPKEIIKNIEVNDLNPDSIKFLEKNLKLNNLSKEELEKNEKLFTHNKDANLFLNEAKGFDYIDIDPFGSPNFLLDAAISRIARKGILAVSATDTAALCGTYPDTCKQKYWAYSALCPQKHEMGVRILIRKVQLLGMQNEKALIPLFTYHYEHYYRIFFLALKGKTKASALFDNTTKIFHYCPHCTLQFLSENHSKKCPECKTNLRVCGPLYSGSLQDDETLNKMLDVLKEEIKVDIKTEEDKLLAKELKREHQELIKLIEDSLEDNKVNQVGSFDIHSIGKKKGFSVEKTQEYIKRLKEKQFKVAKSLFPKTGLKTTASYKEFLEVFTKDPQKNK